MKGYWECYKEVNESRTGFSHTDDQIIQMANGMYLAECVKEGIKEIENRLFRDSQGYKGLRTLMSEAANMCTRIGR